MDPVTIMAGFKLLGEAVGGVVGWRQGHASAEEARQLAVRYWGCVLFEMRQNLISASTCVKFYDDRKNSNPTPVYPTMDFQFADALLGELARMAPLPVVLAEATKT